MEQMDQSPVVVAAPAAAAVDGRDVGSDVEDLDQSEVLGGVGGLGDGVGVAFNDDSGLLTKEDRQFRRAKRTLRSPPMGIRSNSDPVGGTTNGMLLSASAPTSSGFLGSHQMKILLASGKNSRKSRNVFVRSRGQPKKGGAGGKGVWGKPGSELDETGMCQDIRDPNYDSDNQEEYKLEEVDPVLSDEELKKVVEPILLEYLENGNSDEVQVLLSELTLGANKCGVVKLAIVLAMDRHNPQRELVSRLISDLYGCVFSQEDIAKAFDDLLAGLDDLVLDTPEAHVLLGQFIARCVADDCLPPKFITRYKGQVENEWVKSALEKAEVLLSMNHGIAHLDNIWGVGGGNRPVKYLTNKIVELLKEYINSGDVDEAMRCLLELEVPHFHHELVYQAGDLAIEDSTERVRDMMVQLLKFFTSTLVVTATQLEKGLKRLFADIQDISLDVPAAYIILDQLVTRMYTEGVVSDELLKLLPTRGRKRFVSEGDGGRLKPMAF